MAAMGPALAPSDFSWLSDDRLKETVLANLKARIEESVRQDSMVKAFREGSRNIRVHDVGDAIEVEVSGGRAVALEKGVPAHQMVHLEGSTIPIKTPAGTVFRKVTRLSLLMGKWTSKGIKERGAVKGAVDRAMAGTVEAAIEAKHELQGAALPRVRDILGVR